MLSCTHSYGYDANTHTHTHTHTLVHALEGPVCPGLQLQAKRQGWGFRAVLLQQCCRCTIQLQSAAAHRHQPRHPIKNADQQTHTHTHTHTHTDACIHVHLVSWPLVGPHVVGVFSYGAGNGSGESEQRCRLRDKRRRGPGARAKEAPSSAPGPRGPRGAPFKKARCSNRRDFVGPSQHGIK